MWGLLKFLTLNLAAVTMNQLLNCCNVESCGKIKESKRKRIIGRASANGFLRVFYVLINLIIKDLQFAFLQHRNSVWYVIRQMPKKS